MNNTQKPSTAIKVLATVGFLAALALLVWLAVTIVTVIPGAFSSLASIADSLQQARPQKEIVVANQNSIVNNDESFTVTWTNINRDGIYTISYACIDGVAVDMRYPANNITQIPCDETIKLGNSVHSLELIPQSEKKRFIDVPYTIGFIPQGETDVAYATESVFTVVNVNIPQSQGVSNDDTDDEPTGAVAGEEDTATSTETDTETPARPVTPAQPTVITTEVYELPSSDPNGYVDLAVKYLGVGRLDSNNRFIAGGVIDTDTRGAFRFEVRNLGTKTSRDWSFEAELTSGQTFESEMQDGLLPNEYTVITLGFDNVGELGAKRFGAEIDVPGDTNSSNDRFSWAVNIVD